jgi:hypothetical protein
MFTKNAFSIKFLSSLMAGMFILACPLAQAAVSVPRNPQYECFKEVCANFVEGNIQDVYLNIIIPSHAQINLTQGVYGALWVIAIKNGREIGRGLLSEARVGYHAQIPMGRGFSGPFEVYITNFKGKYFSNFGQNFQFTIGRR